MKKSRKLIAVLAATTMAITSLSMTSLTASASSSLNTVRIYHNVDAGKQIKEFMITMNYNSALTCDEVTPKSVTYNEFMSLNIEANNELQMSFLSSRPINTECTIMTTEFYGQNINKSNIFNKITYTAEIKNNNGAAIDPNTIKMNAVLVGDVNGDNIVDDNDVELIRNHILHLTTLSGNNFLAADINNDNLVNNQDTTMLRQYILGTIEHF